MPAATEKLAIPRGSLVLVTGANGYIASHVIDQLLQANFRVRGTVRKLTRGLWLNDHFTSKYGPGKFELVEVPDMAVAHAYDDAVKGASGLIHIATPVLVTYDPNEGIPMVTNGTVNTLESARREPLMKRVVLTSSSTAAASPRPDVEFTMDKGTWNDEIVHAAWAPPPYEGWQRRHNVYAASKTEGEKVAWKWMRENQPGFVLNTVLPNANFGEVLSPQHQGFPSTAGWVRAVWEGFKGKYADEVSNKPQYYVNVRDNALVHVAALIYADVQAERLFAFAQPYNWNDILAVMRKLYPDREFIDDIPDLGRDLSKVTNQGAEDLLKRISGKGWTGFEQTIKEATEGFI
ncbi:aldehyde reductase II [Blastomyces dermatitidis ATCC 18188]|uniref:Aldehyde reductase II n=1 Tax=Ajellomyces dermatitidis (strain ATCC 18188 / CBS 674.68) TaxID=653446 RepID=F2TC44_AJEDA|nr:aldehyde reductase II [Blastomyces dermatitidis ATCC 18188]